MVQVGGSLWRRLVVYRNEKLVYASKSKSNRSVCSFEFPVQCKYVIPSYLTKIHVTYLSSQPFISTVVRLDDEWDIFACFLQ